MDEESGESLAAVVKMVRTKLAPNWHRIGTQIGRSFTCTKQTPWITQKVHVP